MFTLEKKVGKLSSIPPETNNEVSLLLAKRPSTLTTSYPLSSTILTFLDPSEVTPFTVKELETISEPVI